MRKPFVAGNWKMNLTKAGSDCPGWGVAWPRPGRFIGVEVGVIPAFVHLDVVGTALKGSPIGLGAQDLFYEKPGAFTGEISASMLTDLGVKYVLVGHSERRHVIGETDAICNKKLHAVIAGGMTGILCIGEKLEQRQANQTFEVCRTQLVEGLKGIDKSNAGHLVIAYEPVWSIGTGLTATKEQAQEVHAFVRAELAKFSTRRRPTHYAYNMAGR